MAKDEKNVTTASATQQAPAAPSADAATEYLVVTTRDIAPGECSINGKTFTFTKGQAKRVPEQVMLLLKDAGYLAHYAPAR